MKPYLDILKLVWPLALGMVNNAVMQFVDRIYLAHDSMESLEAALPAGVLMWIFAGFFQTVVGYSSVFVAQYHGAGEAANCRASTRAAFALAVAAGILSLPLVHVGGWVLSFSAPSAAVLGREKSYFEILMLGAFFVYAQMAVASYFTGRGWTRIVFWVNLLGNVLNIALDPFLIFGWCGFPRLGISGAAVATVASMAVQWLVLEFVLRREWAGAPVAPEAWRIAVRILRFGVPAGFHTVLNMLSFTIFVFVTGGVGELDLAVSNACFTVNYLLIAPMEGFAIGAGILVGQFQGAKDSRNAAVAGNRVLALALAYIVVSSALVFIFRGPILGLFAADTASLDAAEFMSLGVVLLILSITWQVFDAVDTVISGALKGAGDTRFVMRWMLFSAFAVWLPMVFLVRRFHPTMPAFWATMVVYVVVICIGTAVRWRRGPWRRIKLVEGE